jgi:hypothetical protein
MNEALANRGELGDDGALGFFTFGVSRFLQFVDPCPPILKV